MKAKTDKYYAVQCPYFPCDYKTIGNWLEKMKADCRIHYLLKHTPEPFIYESKSN